MKGIHCENTLKSGSEAGSQQKAQETGGNVVGGDVQGAALGVTTALWMEKMPSLCTKLLSVSQLRKTSESISCLEI